jgi:hypothetical protein
MVVGAPTRMVTAWATGRCVGGMEWLCGGNWRGRGGQSWGLGRCTRQPRRPVLGSHGTHAAHSEESIGVVGEAAMAQVAAMKPHAAACGSRRATRQPECT